MVITGRIFEIVHVNDFVSQIVLKKKMVNKIECVPIEVVGWWRDKALGQMKLKPKDKIKANVYIKSCKKNGKYFSNLYFREIYLIEEHTDAMKDAHKRVVHGNGVVEVDEDTGEVIKES